jgi:hypothetical protein
MSRLTHKEYEALERAIVDGTRVAIRRPGRREHVIIPLRLSLKNGHEIVEARNSTTGHPMEIDLEEVEHLEVVR